MKVFVVSLMHNEADIISQTIDHYIKNKVDGFIVSDILSDDGTKDILEQKRKWCWDNGIKFVLIHEMQFGYFQAIKFNAMARMAASLVYPEDCFVIPIDADEYWHYVFGPVGDFLRKTDVKYFWSGMRNMINTPLDDQSIKDPIKRMRYYWNPNDKRNERSNVKTIYLYRPNVWLELGAHRTRYMEMETTMDDGGLRGHHVHHLNNENLFLCHYPARSIKQFIKKSRANSKSVTVANMQNTGANRHSVERGLMTDIELEKEFYQNYYAENPAKEKCGKLKY